MIKKLIRLMIQMNRYIIYKQTCTASNWEKYINFDDVVKIGNKEYELILSDSGSFIEILQTEDLTSEDYESEQDEYESDSESDC